MEILIDENIIFAIEAFSGLGEVKLLNGRSITKDTVKDADALIVRSITKVNKSLLEGSNVKFVGTATIGTDHIDLNYLREKNIEFADAKGSNADSVAEYVFTALLKVASEEKIELKEQTLGVVGVGNIGSRVVKLAESLGMNVLKNDPPLERNGYGKNYVSLDEIFTAEIVTFHVPLNLEGNDKTHHLVDKENITSIKPGTIVINTSRGPVIDNTALIREAKAKNFRLILDVWENEPSINVDLLEVTKVGTAHIAGYSYEGKVNGTTMIYNSLCSFLKTKPEWKPLLSEIENKDLKIPPGETDEQKLYNLFSSIYKLKNDDLNLRKVSGYGMNERCVYFDKLRKEYPVRREFSNFLIHISDGEEQYQPVLESFRFKVKS